MDKELIKNIRNICENCINDYNTTIETLDETIEDLGYDEAFDDLHDLTDRMFRYYIRILKCLDDANSCDE
jgi:hypothetical protein